jgi:hypothetical protein
MRKVHFASLFPLSIVVVPSSSWAAYAGCYDPPGPTVGWGGGDKRGANLAGANLRGANLASANLEGTSTQGAYFKESLLDAAVWEDGRICPPGSRDACH